MKPGKKKPEIADFMQVGHYFDVYQSSSRQSKLARVIAIKDKEVEFSFDGMAKKHNEVPFLSLLASLLGPQNHFQQNRLR